jgi:hypothetical protein
MTRTRKAFAALAIAIAASVGVAAQTTAFAIADDSHLPLVGTSSGEYLTAGATTTDEGHFPNVNPR